MYLPLVIIFILIVSIEAHILEIPLHQQRRRVHKNSKNLTCARPITRPQLLPALPIDIHRIYYLYELVKWDPMEDEVFVRVTIPSYWAYISLYPEDAECPKNSKLTQPYF